MENGKHTYDLKTLMPLYMSEKHTQGFMMLCFGHGCIANSKIGYMYGTAKKKRPGYLVGNLVATNWPIEKALHAIGYNQIPTK